MREENVSALLVDGGHGIISERDITRALAGGQEGDCPVGRVTTADPITVDATLAIVDAAALMLNDEVRHLVVRSDEGWLGVISLRAVFAVLLQAARPELWLTQLRVQVEMPGAQVWYG
jgi:CBS domain-containing protein